VTAYVSDLFFKIGRMPLEVVAEKARWVARERRKRLRATKAARQLFAPEEICAAPGRTWRRVTSVAELAQLGSELRNCLAARSGRHGEYARQMSVNFASFWALRDEAGAALAAAMIRVSDKRLMETGGPRNARLTRDDPYLDVLIKARCAPRPAAPPCPPAATVYYGDTPRGLASQILMLAGQIAEPADLTAQRSEDLTWSALLQMQRGVRRRRRD
jgi:hypothetical protein